MIERLGFLLPVLRRMKIVRAFLLDALRFARHSNTIAVNGTKSRMMANITYQFHVVEKGLTMPNRRWNFGHAKILPLIDDCHQFIDRYGADNDELRGAVGVLKTYLDEHAAHGVDVPDTISGPISALALRVPEATPVQQKRLSRDEYFADADAMFSAFSRSRGSVRNYSDKRIPVEEMLRSVDIAKSAPSACNRQATRVYIVQEREKIDQILSFQNGNLGFGHLADKLVVLTSDISSFRGADERNFAWMDCGIFAMNLMYALHHLRIGACPLNAGISPAKEKKVREACGIPPEEIVCLFISCGYLPDQIDLANSERKRTEEIARLR